MKENVAFFYHSNFKLKSKIYKKADYANRQKDKKNSIKSSFSKAYRLLDKSKYTILMMNLY